MMHLSSNRLSLEQHLLSSELIIQLLCFPSRCLVEFSRILIKTHFQTPWMLISSKEIKTISTINIKLQLSHQTAEGSLPRQVGGVNHRSAGRWEPVPPGTPRRSPVHLLLTTGVLALCGYWGCTAPRTLHGRWELRRGRRAPQTASRPVARRRPALLSPPAVLDTTARAGPPSGPRRRCWSF